MGSTSSESGKPSRFAASLWKNSSSNSSDHEPDKTNVVRIRVQAPVQHEAPELMSLAVFANCARNWPGFPDWLDKYTDSDLGRKYREYHLRYKARRRQGQSKDRDHRLENLIFGLFYIFVNHRLRVAGAEKIPSSSDAFQRMCRDSDCKA